MEALEAMIEEFVVDKWLRNSGGSVVRDSESGVVPTAEEQLPQHTSSTGDPGTADS
jgi:hypothetical protein